MRRERDSPAVVFGRPDRFGEVEVDIVQKVIAIFSKKHPTALTRKELAYGICWTAHLTKGRKKSGQRKNDCHEWTRTTQQRCPLSSSSYRSVSRWNVAQGTKSHCGEFRRTLYAYEYAVETQQSSRTIEYTEPTMSKRKAKAKRPHMTDYTYMCAQKSTTSNLAVGNPLRPVFAPFLSGVRAALGDGIYSAREEMERRHGTEQEGHEDRWERSLFWEEED